MSTNAQITANRTNSQLSTGPTTEAGLAASSRNNLRHGLASNEILIEGEDPAEYAALLQGYLDEYQPTTLTETTLTSGLARHQWAADRALNLQSRCFDGPEVDEKKLGLFIRYESTHRRQYSKCLNDLLKIRKEKRQTEIGFESQKLTEAKTRLANARAENTEVDSSVRQTMEAPLPGNMRIPFDTLKSLFEAAVREVNKSLSAV